MGGGRALQKAVLEALKRSPAVTQIVGSRVYDAAPSRVKYPYVSFGPADALDSDSDCLEAKRRTLQVDCWTDDQARKGPCEDLTDAVADALHRADLQADPPFAIVSPRVILQRVFNDPDRPVHGVVTLRARVEKG